jgi:hypothetical protein
MSESYEKDVEASKKYVEKGDGLVDLQVDQFQRAVAD